VLAQYVIDYSVGLPGRRARGQPESRRVLERAPQRHLAMDDVILRDVADARVARGAGIDRRAIVPDLAGRGCPQPRENLEQSGLSRSAATCDSNQLTRLDGEGHLVQDLTFPGVLADTGHVDASPDGSPRLQPHCHDILPEFWPDSSGHDSHRRDIGAATLGANLERSWRRRARRRSCDAE
jgi:hypothetical protein